jgi:hypothetical protein
MKDFKDYINWILHNTWSILLSYFASIIVLLLIHGSFGFTMKDDGTYFSNSLMHICSGSVLALGTGILQREFLKKYIYVSYLWVLSLIAGFVLAELIAGYVLWKLEIYRGLINIFNTSNHLPEASIFAFAGLISGILQFRLLRPYYKKAIYWIVTSMLGWSFLILSTYPGLFAFIIGAILYGVITGFAFYRIMELKTTRENLN